MGRIVKGEGPKNPLLVLVGEAPGAEEERVGRPFVGPSGFVLETKLSRVGVARQECYITNVVKERPPNNNFNIYWNGKKPSEKLKRCIEELKQELAWLGQDELTVVALGKNALYALVGRTDIGRCRGSIYYTNIGSCKVRVIPTYHPSAVQRQYELGAIFEVDLYKALKEKSLGLWEYPARNIIISPTYAMVEEYCSRAEEEGIVAFDIETLPGSGIICISLSFSPDSAISIPLTVSYWRSHKELLRVLKVIGKLMASDTTKVGQNILFDIQYLMRFLGILPKKPWHDTMVMQHTLYPEFPKSLDFLASIYTREPYYKDDLKVWKQSALKDMNLLWHYNAKDSTVTLECYYAMEKELFSDKDHTHTYHYTMDLFDPILHMCLSGVRLDRDATNRVRAEKEAELAELQEAFEKKFPGVNPDSPTQVARLAYDTLKLKPVTKQGRRVVDEKAIEKLSQTSPELRMVLDLRQTRKLISTYLNVETDPVDDILRFSVNPTGTSTGRMSSNKSVFWIGFNIQNIPKNIRHIILPRKDGNVFIEVDLVGAEAMVMAYLTEDELLIDKFEKGENIHIYTATKVIWPELTEDDILADKKELEEKGLHTRTKYFMAKKVRHGGNYRLSWKGLQEQLLITAKEAKELLQRFYDRSPRLVAYHQKVREQLRATRTIVTPFGRKRCFYGRLDDRLLRQALAFVPQETVTRVINIGLKSFYSDVCSRYRDVSAKLQVHDSLLVECPSEMVSFVASKLKDHLSVPITIHGRTFTLGLDFKVGPNWRDMEDLEVN